MGLLSWPNEILVLKAHSLHSKGLSHSILEHSLQVLDLGFEWSKDSTSVCDSPPQACHGCWIFILHTYYSWSYAPRRLEVALKLPLYVVSLGKFVLPFVVIVGSSRSVFVTTWVRKGLRGTQLFVSPSTMTYDALWIWTSGLNLVSLMCSCIYFLFCCHLPTCWA
jgi:hypothetical protein